MSMPIRLGQKWQRTKIGPKNKSYSQWAEGAAYTHGAQVFGGVGFLMFSMCSPEIPTSFQHVPQVHNVFSNMFPISPQFIPYPFALSSKLVTYLYIYKQPKGRDCNISILRLSEAWLYFYLFLWWANQRCS